MFYDAKTKIRVIDKGYVIHFYVMYCYCGCREDTCNTKVDFFSQTETVQVLKRVCQTIWRGEGIIKKVENLGIRETPYVMATNDGQKCREAR